VLYVKVPKDLREYKEKVAAGRTKQEFFWLILAFVLGFITFIVSFFTVGTQVGSFLTMAIAIPLFLCGFITVQDMTTLDFVKIVMRYKFNKQYLTYHNDLNAYDTKSKKKSKEAKKFKKEMKKMNENQ